VIELRGPDHELVAAVIVEIQLRRDPRKRFSWPLYLSSLRASSKCDVVLLVLTSRPAIARWARTPIETGHPGFTLQPIAISLDDLPRSISPETARKVPELAVLAAIAHRDADAAAAAIRVIDRLPPEQSKLYLDLVLNNVSDEVRSTMEARMKGYVFKNPWVIKNLVEPVERAEAKGLKQGVQQGRKEGRKEGREESLQSTLRVLIRDKLKTVPRVYGAALSSLDDPRALTRLIRAVSRAPDAHRVRQVLSEALRRPASRSKAA
jgi:hypothetical protein